MGVQVYGDGCFLELVQPTEAYIILLLKKETSIGLFLNLTVGYTSTGPSYGTRVSNSDFYYFFFSNC